MSAIRASDGSKKRKKTARPEKTPRQQLKKTQPPQPPSQTPTLITPHVPIITELTPKYDVHSASVISSTQIRKRVTSTTRHLLDQDAAQTTAIALLFARPAEVCKLITIVEHCKRVLKEEGKTCVQYNQMFEFIPEQKRPDVVEKTVLEGDEEECSDNDDDFEVMESRFEKAVLPPPRTRFSKSMRVFLSLKAIPELKEKSDITVQTTESKKP